MTNGDEMKTQDDWKSKYRYAIRAFILVFGVGLLVTAIMLFVSAGAARDAGSGTTVWEGVLGVTFLEVVRTADADGTTSFAFNNQWGVLLALFGLPLLAAAPWSSPSFRSERGVSVVNEG